MTRTSPRTRNGYPRSTGVIVAVPISSWSPGWTGSSQGFFESRGALSLRGVGFPGPVVGVERGQGGKGRRHSPPVRLLLDHLARPPAQELGIHEELALEEDLADAAVGDDPSEEFKQSLGGRRELGGLDQEKAVANRLLAHELS